MYFQWLLQGQARGLGLWPKSVYLYGWGVAINMLTAAALEPAVLGLRSGNDGAFRGFDSALCLVVGMGAVGGLVTGLLLKHMDAIMKVRMAWYRGGVLRPSTATVSASVFCCLKLSSLPTF